MNVCSFVHPGSLDRGPVLPCFWEWQGSRPLPTQPPGFLLQICLSWYQEPKRGARLDANFDNDSNTPHLPDLCQF